MEIETENGLTELPLRLDESCRKGFEQEAKTANIPFGNYLEDLLEKVLDGWDIVLNDSEELSFTNYQDRVFDVEVVEK